MQNEVDIWQQVIADNKSRTIERKKLWQTWKTHDEGSELLLFYENFVTMFTGIYINGQYMKNFYNYNKIQFST